MARRFGQAKLRVTSHQLIVRYGFRNGIGLTTREAERYNRALDRRDGRVVEGTPLLREHTPKKCIEGSNPSLSASKPLASLCPQTGIGTILKNIRKDDGRKRPLSGRSGP